jgi:hypothetical protein
MWGGDMRRSQNKDKPDKSNPQEICCAIHGITKLICPRCIAAKGGRKTARTHSHEQLSAYGRLGGRPKKKKKGRPKAKK